MTVRIPLAKGPGKPAPLQGAGKTPSPSAFAKAMADKSRGGTGWGWGLAGATPSPSCVDRDADFKRCDLTADVAGVAVAAHGKGGFAVMACPAGSGLLHLGHGHRLVAGPEREGAGM